MAKASGCARRFLAGLGLPEAIFSSWKQVQTQFKARSKLWSELCLALVAVNPREIDRIFNTAKLRKAARTSNERNAPREEKHTNIWNSS